METIEIDKKECDDSGFNDHNGDDMTSLVTNNDHHIHNNVMILPTKNDKNGDDMMIRYHKSNCHNGGDDDSNNSILHPSDLDKCFQGKILINNTSLVTL